MHSILKIRSCFFRGSAVVIYSKLHRLDSLVVGYYMGECIFGQMECRSLLSVWLETSALHFKKLQIYVGIKLGAAGLPGFCFPLMQ